MTRRDPVTGMTDKEMAALAAKAYAECDDAEAWGRGTARGESGGAIGRLCAVQLG